eukprot:s3841_g18.t1
MWGSPGILAFLAENKEGSPRVHKGYEPKSLTHCVFLVAVLAMVERSHSVPVNPFHSNRVQQEYLLDAARPADLPLSPSGHPLQNLSGATEQLSQVNGPTGKGRGSASAGFVDMSGPTDED